MLNKPSGRRPKRLRAKPRPPLTIQQILEWADAHFERTGRWPLKEAGPLREAIDTRWHTIHNALRVGRRGLPGGSSLARLLAEYRGVRNIHALPPLTIKQILAWADAQHLRAGAWPHYKSGSIVEAPGESWATVNHALCAGTRGLAGGASLAELLERRRGVRNIKTLPRLRTDQILQWADAYYRRTGALPKSTSGHVADAPGETWSALNRSLTIGGRGLPGRSSVAKLLARHRAKRNHMALPRYTLRGILSWADSHRKRVGAWPNRDSGAIIGVEGETWCAVNLSRRWVVECLFSPLLTRSLVDCGPRPAIS